MDAFSELNARDKIIEVVRWVAVLPAAALAGTAAHVAAILLNSAGCTAGMMNPEESTLDRFYVVVLANVAMGAGAVIAGARTAPRRQSETAIGLAALLVFYSGMIFTALLQRPTTIWDYVAVPITAVASVGAAFHVYSERSQGTF
ncbi:MAG TPA: hypothetical protein VEL28_01995 [Candidatus Binatia bacterium]|nr:hypothetical protein [Candidatus Binatia bacterium]